MLRSSKKGRVPRGDCHYLAGSVARYTELHLMVWGSVTAIGACGLVPHLKMNKGTFSGSWMGTWNHIA